MYDYMINISPSVKLVKVCDQDLLFECGLVYCYQRDGAFVFHDPCTHNRSASLSCPTTYCVSLTTLSTAFAKYSTLCVFRPAMEMRPFLVM
jgi:hypothetical protein